MSIHEWSGDCQSNSGVRGYTDIVGGGVGGVGGSGGGGAGGGCLSMKTLSYK